MNSHLKQIALAGYLAFTLSLVHAEQDPSWSVGANFKNAYISEGRTFNDDLVIQPWAEVSGVNVFGLPVGLAFWANYDFEDYGGSIEGGNFQEIDYDVFVDIPNPYLDIRTSVRIWTYPESNSDTDVLVAIDLGTKLATTGFYLGFYADVGMEGGADGDTTLKPYLAYTKELNEDWSAGAKANLYYQNFSHGETGFGAYDLGVNLQWKLLDASVAYIGQLDDDVLPDGEFQYDVEVLASFGVSYSF